MDDDKRTKRVPQAALRFRSEFALGDNGDGAKSAPFSMVARSGQPIEHWFWGRVVHDLDGMRLSKARIPIDYAHDDREVIGYANKFDVESGDLKVSGALVPYKDSDRATEIIYKQQNGIPYEASINFGGDGIRVEEIREGQVTQVNGYEFSGPGMVIREWPLRGIAICPYGADANTSTQFSSGGDVTVEISEAAMPDETKPQEVENEQPVAEEKEVTESVEAETPAEPDTAEAEQAVEAPAESKSLGQRYLDEFGVDGAVWFAQGKSFEEARDLFVQKLKAERDDLRNRLAAISNDGEQDPVEFSESKPKPKPKRVIRLAGKRYDD